MEHIRMCPMLFSFENYFLQQFIADHLANFLALLAQLMGLLLAAKDLVPNRLEFAAQAVHCGMVLELESQANVPVLWIALGFLDEQFVVNDQPLTLFFLEKWLAGLLQAGQVFVHMGGLNSDQRDAPHRAFGVVLLRKQ